MTLNHSSTSLEQFKNVKKSIHLKPLNNKCNIDKSSNKTFKLVESLLTKYYLTAYNIILAYNTKVMKILEVNKMMNKVKEIKMMNNKPQKIKNLNLKEKMLSQQPPKESLKKNLNVKINEIYLITLNCYLKYIFALNKWIRYK